jgi:hypothetical protein
MKIARLASLMLVAILAIGLMAASAASAEPEFNPVGATLTGTSGTAILTAGANTVTCAKDTSTSGASKTTATLIGGITVHFLECTGKNSTSGESCPAKSEGAPLTNLILTKTLHGVLGLILPKPETGSGVALLLLPVAGVSFVNIQAACLSPAETTVEGKVAGAVDPVGTKTLKGKLLFFAPSGVQAIKEVDLSTGGLVKVSLKAFGVATATEETTEETTFSEATEVT